MAEILDHFKDKNADLRTNFILFIEMFIIITGFIATISYLFPVLLFSFESGFDVVSVFFLFLSLLFVAAPFIYAIFWRIRIKKLGHEPNTNESKILVISRIFTIFSIIFAWMGVLFLGLVCILITPKALAGEIGLPSDLMVFITIIGAFVYVILLSYYFRYTYKCYHQPKDSIKENS